MTFSDSKRIMYKMMLTEVAKQTDLYGAVAAEFLRDVDALFNVYNQVQDAKSYTYKQKIFDLLAQFDSLDDYQRDFVIGVAKYYGDGTQTPRQEAYLQRLWTELQKDEAAEKADPVIEDWMGHTHPHETEFNPFIKGR